MGTRTAATRRGGDRGAVALLTPVLLAVLLVSAAFAVDLGRLRVARADLQAVADVVALDLARELDGRQAHVLLPELEVLAERSLLRNSEVMADDARLGVEVGDVQLDGRFRAVTSGVPTAVRVTARARVPYAFAGVVDVDAGRATRRAVANAVQSACYSVGSYAAAVDSRSSAVLDPLLDKLAEQTGAFANGYGVGQAIGYQGLASASVELGAVATGLGLGSVSELANATVGVRPFYSAVAAAIGPGNAVALQMLNVMAQQANTARTVSLGKVLDIESGSGALAQLRANVLDLVLGSLYAINGTNAVDLYLSSGLTRLSYLGVKVKAIQGPHLYCGQPGSAFTTGTAPQTEQLNVSGQGILNPVTVDTTLDAIPGITLTPAALRAPMWSSMPFTLSVASTESWLRRVRCGSSPGVDLDVDNRLATLVLNDVQFSEASLTTRIRILGVEVAVNVVVGNANASTIRVELGATGKVPFTIDVPPRQFDTPYPTQAGGVRAVATVRSGVSVRISPTVSLPLLGLYAGADVGALVSSADRTAIAQAVVDRVVDVAFDRTAAGNLVTSVFEPLLALAGVRLGGSDVILHSRPPMECGRPALRG